LTNFYFYAILIPAFIQISYDMSDNTILDKILTQKHADEIRAFNPITVVDDLMKGLSEREKTVIVDRFGLSNDGNRATLEEIGTKLNVTRERVRQIIKGVITKLRDLQIGHEEIQRFTRIAEQLLQSFGGVLEKDFFTSELLALSEIAKTELARRRATLYLEFVLNDIVIEAIEHRPANKIRRAVYAIPGIDDKLLTTVVTELVNIINEAGESLSEEELIERFKNREVYNRTRSILIDEPVRLAREFFRTGVAASIPSSMKEEAEVLCAYIAAAATLEQNIFDEWGKRDWAMIHPKRMNDKIYLILRHEEKPMHFVSITEKINAALFDHKIAKSPSVHNELILDKRFVLVGRGIYALKEWGFERGTVAEVITKILRESGELTREQMVEAVLQRRFVKKQTIHLALMNRKLFAKHTDGRYVLVS